MKHRTFIILAALTAPGLAVGQAPRPGSGAGASVASLQPLYERIKHLYIRSAELMPEEHYGFRPVATVRTYAQLLGHVANENYLFCAAAKGEQNPNTTDFEKTTAKAAMVRAITDSFAYCDPAYRMPEAQAMEEVTFFDEKGTRLWVLIYNVTHDSEHYGNVVTYLRMKGLVPPSSQSGM